MVTAPGGYPTTTKSNETFKGGPDDWTGLPFPLFIGPLRPSNGLREARALRLPVEQASQAAEKMVYFVIPSEARNLSSIETR
jgi:hypothetical protein